MNTSTVNSAERQNPSPDESTFRDGMITNGSPVDSVVDVDVETGVRTDRSEDVRTIHLPRFHVVLHNDDDHSYEYVIEMLSSIFGHTSAKAYEMATIVDSAGRVVVDTTTKERADLKQSQIHAFGADWRIPYCVGSMSASLEPAE